jgi:hypothetical protein
MDQNHWREGNWNLNIQDCMLLLKLNRHIWWHYEINQRVNYLKTPYIWTDWTLHMYKELLSVPCSAAIELRIKLLSASWFVGTFNLIKSALAGWSSQRRPKRQIKKPACFQTNESNYNETTSETESTFYKIKRILAQRKRDKPEDLVQFMGEPAQNAVWTTFDQLYPQAQKSVVRRPPQCT